MLWYATAECAATSQIGVSGETETTSVVIRSRACITGCRGSSVVGSDPAPRVIGILKEKYAQLSRHQKPERVHGLPDPSHIGDDGNPFPAGQVPDADAEIFPYRTGINVRKFRLTS